MKKLSNTEAELKKSVTYFDNNLQKANYSWEWHQKDTFNGCFNGRLMA